MPRKRLSLSDRPPPIYPDIKFNSILVSKLINKVLKKGKKNLAQRIVYSAFDYIKETTQQDGLKVFQDAVNKVKPILEVRPRRVGGATYQVPLEVSKSRSESLALRWIIEAAKLKKGKPFFIRLAEEIISASKKEGSAYKKREDTHRMAEANRAFVHYRW